MAITASRPKGRGQHRYFKYRPFKKTLDAAGQRVHATKLEFVTNKIPRNGDGVLCRTRIRQQRGLVCSPANFPGVVPAPGKTLLQTLLGRVTASQKCVMGNAPHVCAAAICTPENFYDTLDVHDSVELRETEQMGVGVFATAAIPAKKIIALYAGELKPNQVMTRREKDYSAEIRKVVLAAGGQPQEVSVTALREGSWARFVNHHCKSNCALIEGKMNCGDIAVSYIRTRRNIPVGAQLFIDYGKEYFRTVTPGGRTYINGNGCLCGLPPTTKPKLPDGTWPGCHSKKRRRAQ